MELRFKEVSEENVQDLTRYAFELAMCDISRKGDWNAKAFVDSSKWRRFIVESKLLKCLISLPLMPSLCLLTHALSLIVVAALSNDIEGDVLLVVVFRRD